MKILDVWAWFTKKLMLPRKSKNSLLPILPKVTSTCSSPPDDHNIKPTENWAGQRGGWRGKVAPVGHAMLLEFLFCSLTSTLQYCMQPLNKLYQSTGISNLQDLALLLQPSSLFLHRVIPLEHFIQNVATGVTKKKMIVCIFLLF